MRSLSMIFVFFVFEMFSLRVAANDIAGSWVFEKGFDYFLGEKNIQPPAVLAFQIVGDTLVLGPNCSVPLKKKALERDRVFQLLWKADQSNAQIDAYFKRKFSIDLGQSNSYAYYLADDYDCNKLGKDIFLSGTKLIFQYGSDSFSAFTRTKVEQPLAKSGSMDLAGRKFSQLPFNRVGFNDACRKYMPWNLKTPPRSTLKCAPAFFPYVATKQDKDPLAQLIGSHHYLPGERDSDFNNPVAHNLHPVFMLLPPLKDVLPVFVIDFEETEMRGNGDFYLSIVGGKIVDQWSQGYCSIDANYFCIDDQGKKVFQLLENGKFKALK